MSEPMDPMTPQPAAEPAPRTAPAPYAAGTGTAPLNPDRTAWDRMGYRERLALKRENPEAYREMKKY